MSEPTQTTKPEPKPTIGDGQIHLARTKLENGKPGATRTTRCDLEADDKDMTKRPTAMRWPSKAFHREAALKGGHLKACEQCQALDLADIDKANKRATWRKVTPTKKPAPAS